MPRRNGTGPMGFGSMTGRGLGFCTGANVFRYRSGFRMGLGLAYRRGFGKGFAGDEIPSKRQKELLQKQKEILYNRLEVIDKQLERL